MRQGQNLGAKGYGKRLAKQRGAGGLYIKLMMYYAYIRAVYDTEEYLINRDYYIVQYPYHIFPRVSDTVEAEDTPKFPPNQFLVACL